MSYKTDTCYEDEGPPCHNCGRSGCEGECLDEDNNSDHSSVSSVPSPVKQTGLLAKIFFYIIALIFLCFTAPFIGLPIYLIITTWGEPDNPIGAVSAIWLVIVAVIIFVCYRQAK